MKWYHSSALRSTDEVTIRHLVDVFLAAGALRNILSTQLLAMLYGPPHPLNPFKRKRTMPLTVTLAVWSPVVDHDNVPPIIHISTNPAGIAKMYTHLGSPSKLLFSLIKMSISSFIIVCI